MIQRLWIFFQLTAKTAVQWKMLKTEINVMQPVYGSPPKSQLANTEEQGIKDELLVRKLSEQQEIVEIIGWYLNWQNGTSDIPQAFVTGL